MGSKAGDTQTYLNVALTCALVFIAFCATIPLEIADLSLALGGGLTYWLLTSLGQREKSQKATQKKLPSDENQSQSTRQQCENSQMFHAKATWAPPSKPLQQKTSTPAAAPQQQKTSTPAAAPDYRQPSVKPVAAPVFCNSGWDAEVQELLTQISPTVQTDEVVKGVVDIVEGVLKPLFPEASVEGFASGNPLGAKAFAIAVPEVDIVLNASAQELMQALACEESLNERQVAKCATRTCCSELVKTGGMKFRRSAFQSDEPKVILLVPASLGLADTAFSVNFSVNTSTPQRAAALLKECAWIDCRAKELLLLVRRWARDRGISHAPKGHLPPYAWTLLSMFFLQKELEGNPALLPPMDYANKLLTGKQHRKKKAAAAKSNRDGEEKTCASLFKEFVQFYLNKFDLSKEVVSLCSVCHAKPKAWLMPIIEDPFDAARNIGECVNSAGLDRLREELARAQTLLARDASLSELLEPWAPPDKDSHDDNDGSAESDELSWQQKRIQEPLVREKKPNAAPPGSLTASIPQRLAPRAGSLTSMPERLGPKASFK